MKRKAGSEPELVEFDAGELEIAPTVHYSDKGILVEVIGVRYRVSMHLTFYQAAALRSRLAHALDQGDNLNESTNVDAAVGHAGGDRG